MRRSADLHVRRVGFNTPMATSPMRCLTLAVLAIAAAACQDPGTAPASPAYGIAREGVPDPHRPAPDPCTDFPTPECQGFILPRGGNTWYACTVLRPWGDADYDGVDDACESEVAKAFAPTLIIHSEDGDSTRETYYAVKKSSLGGPTLSILYMLRYHRDTGIGAHAGDSEFILATVTFDATYGRWKLIIATYSSHWGSILDKTQNYPWEQLWYTDGLGNWNFGQWRRNPVAYVSKDKHANYESGTHCNAVEEGNPCAGVLVISRVVLPEDGRNVGSAAQPFVDCTLSINPSQWPGTECFWDTAWLSFRGWTGGAYGTAPPPYWVILHTYGW